MNKLTNEFSNPHCFGYILFNNYKSFNINLLINMLIDNGFHVDRKIRVIYSALNINIKEDLL